MRDLKNRLRVKFAAVDGKFSDGTNWSLLPMRKLVEFLLSCRKYHNVNEAVSLNFSFFFFKINLFQRLPLECLGMGDCPLTGHHLY